MKRLMLVFLAVITIGLLMTMPVIAQEPELGTPRDNACNEGGAMFRADDGTGCTTEWHWVCGWYLARWFEAGGWGGSYVMPDWCRPENLLPPQPPPPPPPPVTITAIFPGCHLLFLPPAPPEYANFGTNLFLPLGSPIYSNDTCTTQIGTLFTNMVYATTQNTANSLCALHFPATPDAGSQSNNTWMCN